MPTYEYGCNTCGYRFEEFQSITDDPIVKCPKCEKSTVKRLVSGGAGLIFKGSGFYITDYKNNNSQSHAKSDGNGSAKNSSESKQSSDTKASGSKESSKSDKE